MRVLFQALPFSLHPHPGRGQGALWNLFDKGTDPIHVGSTSGSSLPPKDPTPWTSRWALGVQDLNSEGTYN